MTTTPLYWDKYLTYKIVRDIIVDYIWRYNGRGILESKTWRNVCKRF